MNKRGISFCTKDEGVGAYNFLFNDVLPSTKIFETHIRVDLNLYTNQLIN